MGVATQRWRMLMLCSRSGWCSVTRARGEDAAGDMGPILLQLTTEERGTGQQHGEERVPALWGARMGASQ